MIDGKSIIAVSPFPSSLFKTNSPRWAFAIRATIGKLKPCPLFTRFLFDYKVVQLIVELHFELFLFHHLLQSNYTFYFLHQSLFVQQLCIHLDYDECYFELNSLTHVLIIAYLPLLEPFH